MSRRAIPAVLLVLIGLIGMVVVGRDTTERDDPVLRSDRRDVDARRRCLWLADRKLVLPGRSDVGRRRRRIRGGVEPRRCTGRRPVHGPHGRGCRGGRELHRRVVDTDHHRRRRVDVGAVRERRRRDRRRWSTGRAGRAEHPLGDSVAACSNDTSDTWYVADGYTLDDSVETLILTNPFDEPVVAEPAILDRGAAARARTVRWLHGAAPLGADDPDRGAGRP